MKSAILKVSCTTTVAHNDFYTGIIFAEAKAISRTCLNLDLAPSKNQTQQFLISKCSQNQKPNNNNKSTAHKQQQNNKATNQSPGTVTHTQFISLHNLKNEKMKFSAIATALLSTMVGTATASEFVHENDYLVFKTQKTANGSGNSCLDIQFDDMQDTFGNGSPVILYPCDGYPSQQWIHDSNGYLRSVLDTTKCIVSVDGKTQSGTNLMVWDCLESDDRFRFDIDWKDNVIHPMKDATKCAEISSSSDDVTPFGFPIIQFANCNTSQDSQKWSWYDTLALPDGYEVVSKGNVGIGPGSYYLDDEEVSIFTSQAFSDVDSAWEWVQSYDFTENPIVMWQLVQEGSDLKVWAHFKKFMTQNLDASTGESPREFAQAQADYVKSVPGHTSGDVFVRSDEWWNVNLPTNIWQIIEGGNVEIGPGSYYLNDATISVIRSDIKDEASALEYVESFDSTDNQVVMWQLDNFGGSSMMLKVHFKKFMFQNLDSQTGFSPNGFAQAQADWLESTQGSGKGGIVHVRTDYWWSSNDEM